MNFHALYIYWSVINATANAKANQTRNLLYVYKISFCFVQSCFYSRNRLISSVDSNQRNLSRIHVPDLFSTCARTEGEKGDRFKDVGRGTSSLSMMATAKG